MIATVGLLPAKFVKQAADLLRATQPHKYRPKMKVPHLLRTLFPVAIISVAAALPAHAQMIANALTNGDFETNTAGTGQVKTGFSGHVTGFSDISTPGATQTENSGVQYGPAKTGNPGGSGLIAESGNYFLFLQGGDPGAFQITGTTLTLGETITLTGYAADSYQAAGTAVPTLTVGILTAASTTSTFGAATQSATQSVVLPAYTAGMNPAPYSMFSLTYTAGAADVGKDVGIFFNNAGATNTFINTDNYVLAVTSAVPEPRTYGMVIMGVVGGALLVIRRRKQTLSRNLCA